MGKKKRGGNRGGKRAPKNDEYRTDLLEKADMRNERFFAYYKAQKIVPDEEWDQFLESLRTPLPTTFRVAGSRQTANSLNVTIRDVHVPALSDVTFEDQAIPPPVQIPWYPDSLAWQFNVPKKVLRKSPEFKKFHSFLVFETEVGNISRQEAVSMLPPLFLGVEPHHTVMDMCAAPGSKTAQLLEALHAQDTLTASSIPPGLLVANDSDYKRTHLLIHQSARLPSPALMVTNLDASNYPTIRLPALPGSKRLEQLLFDRILCDVPCSGDGTIRKNIGIWKSWQPNDGNGLHSLQLRILQRAMKMLKPDGRIVYSTCSFNPVENEAVVAAALQTNPEFHLVDVSSSLPQLIRRPGLTKWRPTSDKEVEATYESYDAFVTAEPQAATMTKLTPGHWPPNNVEELNLVRCMRIYPHLQDSGGFFVAVLERRSVKGSQPREKRRAVDGVEAPEPETKKPRLEDDAGVLDSKPESMGVTRESSVVDSATVDDAKSGTENGGGGGSFKEMPYTFLSVQDPTLVSCLERLHLTPEFPSSNVLVRNPEGDVVRSMYLTNDLVKQVIQNNNFTKIRLTAAGTKVFTKQEGGKGLEAQYRILGEGLPVALPYVAPQSIITGNMSVLKILVDSHYPLCSSFEEPFRDVLESLDVGCHIVKFPPGELQGATLAHELLVPIWKSSVSISLMVDKKAKNALSLRVFGKELPTSNRDKAKKDESVAQVDDAAETKVAMDVIEEATPEVQEIVIQAL